MKTRITFSALISIIVFIVAFAILCPTVNICRIEPVGNASFDAIFEGRKIDCSEKNVAVDKSEQFDYIITCDLSGKQIKSINVTFKNVASVYTNTQIEFAQNINFDNGSVASLKRFQGDNDSCISVESNFFRISTNEEIDCISFYESQPQETVKPLQLKISRFIAVVVFTIVAFVFAFFVDKRFNLFLKLLLRIKNSKNRILFFIAGITSATVISVLLELLVRIIVGPDSVGKSFNTTSFCIIAAVLIIVFLFYFERKNLQQRPERLVAMLILVIGMLIIFIEPFSHNSSDEDSHYYYAVQNSFYEEAYLTTADFNVRNTIDFAIAHSLEESAKNIATMNENGQVASYAIAVESMLPHKPAGILIAVARLFGASFRERFMTGQFGFLLVYAITVYFAVKKIKSGKMIMSVIALLPTNIILACNYSYDPWVTGFSLLGTAYYVSELQQPQKKITVLETVIMCGAFVLAALPKQIYCVLLILPMFMFKKWSCKSEKIKYYILLAAFFAFIFIQFLARSFSAVAGEGDWRGGEVNPMAQVEYIFGNPIEYTIKLLKFVWEYISFANANKSINFFSYLGHGGSPIIFILLIAFCSITDKSDIDRFYGANLVRIIIVLLAFGLICMMATALYIDFTPVANETIKGCHPRYLMPLIAPLTLVIVPPIFAIKQKKYIYNGVVLSVMIGVLIFKIVSIIAVKTL